MVTSASPERATSSQRNLRATLRWQDKAISCFWLPFSLLFDLWVYFTPTYEEQWGLEPSASNASQTRPHASNSLLITTLVVTSVLGFALFALLTLPPMAARVLLILAFGFSFRQFMRPKR